MSAHEPASRWQWRIPSATFRLAPLRAELRALLRGLSLPQSAIHDVVLATHEAVVNAMLHGNGLDASRHVELCIEISDEWLVVQVEDEGAGFDWREWVPPRRHRPTPPDALKGRGILVMTRAMDSVVFSEAGNVVRMAKERRAQT